MRKQDMLRKGEAMKGQRRMKWLDLGMSDPLTLGMAHPLADRLECLATPKVNKAVSRSVTAALMVTVAIATAPFTIASENVATETRLQDSVVKSDAAQSNRAKVERQTATVTRKNNKKSRSKITVARNNDGDRQAYEITIIGDTFEAARVGRFGKKTPIELSEIVGFDQEKATASKSWSFDINDAGQLVFETGSALAKHKHYDKNRFPHGHQHDENEAKRLAAHARLKQAETRREALMAEAEKSARLAEKEHKHVHRIEVKRLEGLKELEKLEGLKGLEALKGLEQLKGLEKLKGLEALKNLENMETLSAFITEGQSGNIIVLDDGTTKVERYVWSADTPKAPAAPVAPFGAEAPEAPAAPQIFVENDGVVLKKRFYFPDGGEGQDHTVFHFDSDDHSFFSTHDHKKYSQQARLSAATSMLESVEDMLDDLDESDRANRDLAEARRDLKRARKSLRDAEKKILKAQEKNSK
jgi:hypothetical protein